MQELVHKVRDTNLVKLGHGCGIQERIIRRKNRPIFLHFDIIREKMKLST